MTKEFTSWREIEKTYFPKDYALSLAKSEEIDELARYLVDNKLEVNHEMIKAMTPSNIGGLLGKISIINASGENLFF